MSNHTMRALRILAPGHAEVVEAARPEPAPGEVRVRVLAVNTCPQWDLHLMAGEPMFPGVPLPYPYTLGQPGHEMVGEVDALGPGVDGLRPGQRVAAWRDAGHDRPGCYAEYVCHDAGHLLPVPDNVDVNRVASLELAMCVAVSVEVLVEMGAIAGRRAVVNGLGPAGLIAAQFLRAEGATAVAGFEPHAGRRALALERGLVDEAHDPTDPATVEALPPARWPECRRGPYDVGIDCAGQPQAVRFLMDRVRRHVALFAVQRDDYVFAPAHGGLVLVGYRNHHLGAARYALERILSGDLDLRPLVSTELPLDAYSQGIELLRRQEALKIGFRP